MEGGRDRMKGRNLLDLSFLNSLKLTSSDKIKKILLQGDRCEKEQLSY